MATQAPEALQTEQQPTRVRYWVIFFAVTLAVITYIDRVALSNATGEVQKILSPDPDIAKLRMGFVFSAFIAAYSLFEIPTGYLGDLIGPRRVLMRIVVWWSFFIAATGRAWNFASLLVIQILFGAGEAGCFPNIAKAFSTWLPREERVRAQGIIWLSARWGGALTPLLVRVVYQYVSWRTAFALFGLVGLIWAFFFFRWFRDKPSDNPNVNAAELALLRGSERLAGGHHVPWKKFLAAPQVWLLCAQYFCLSYGWYFYITWLPTYLREARHLGPGDIARLAGLPLFFGGLGSLFCGFIAKPVTRLVGSVTFARRLLACTGFIGASALLIVSTRFANPFYAVLAMSFASFCNDLAMPTSWGACMDVGGKYAGTLSGTMNMMGNLGGALAPSVIGIILKYTHNNWNINFYVSAAVYFLGTFFWLALDPVTPLERTEVEP